MKNILYIFILSFLFSFSVFATDCYEEDHTFDEFHEFDVEGYKIIISQHVNSYDIEECVQDCDYFKVIDPSGQEIFELPRLGHSDYHDFQDRLVVNYDDYRFKEPQLIELVKELKRIEGEDWKYFIASDWNGNCGGCVYLHQISFKEGFQYHGRIFLQPATYATDLVASLEKVDIHGETIYEYMYSEKILDKIKNWINRI